MSDVLGVLGLILLVIGTVSIPVGWIWLAVLGFRENALWGLMLTVFPTPAAAFFAFDHWKERRLPILLHCGGVLLWIVGAALIPWSH